MAIPHITMPITRIRQATECVNIRGKGGFSPFPQSRIIKGRKDKSDGR